MHITITLPCKEYVAAYLQNLYGNPLIINNKNEIGKYLYSLIEKGSRENDKRCGSHNYKTTMAVRLTEKIVIRNGYLITDTSISNFNNFVEAIIKRSMRAYLTALTKTAGYEIKKSVKEFHEAFGFTEENFPYETILKDFQRFNNKKKLHSGNVLLQ